MSACGSSREDLEGNHHKCTTFSTSVVGITERNNSHLHDNVQLIGLGRTVCNPS